MISRVCVCVNFADSRRVPKEIPQITLANNAYQTRIRKSLTFVASALLFFLLLLLSSLSFYFSIFLYFYRFCNHFACKYCEPDACSISFSCPFSLSYSSHSSSLHTFFAQTQISQRARKFFSFSLTRLLQHRHTLSPLISKNATMKFSSLFFYYTIYYRDNVSPKRREKSRCRKQRRSPVSPSPFTIDIPCSN